MPPFRVALRLGAANLQITRDRRFLRLIQVMDSARLLPHAFNLPSNDRSDLVVPVIWRRVLQAARAE